MDLTPLLALVAAVALLCEYMDASIGMGYGTTLTPLLLLMGFSPLEVVPAVLLGQLVGGVAGGLTHHRVGNINLDFRPDEEVKKRLWGLGYLPRSLDSKVILVLAACGAVGAVVGVLFAVSIPEAVLRTYIGVMLLGIGMVILWRRSRRSTFSWKGLIGVGLLSSFNKGSSGGGYGPLVTAGQLIVGRAARNSVGSTTVAEVIVCLVGFASYLVVKGDIYWALAVATGAGSVVAAPFAALTVKRVNSNRLKFVIGVATVLLGALTLARTFIF